MRAQRLSAWLVGLALIAGCNGGNQGFHEVPKGTRVKEEPHAEHGPHSGHLVELGEEEAHAEVVFDPKDARLTIYVLDSSAKKPVPIEAKELKVELAIKGQLQTFAAKAAAESGDPAGKSSRFEITGNPDIKANINDEEDLKGSVTVPVNGKTYTGKIVHEHEHEHGAEGGGGDAAKAK